MAFLAAAAASSSASFSAADFDCTPLRREKLAFCSPLGSRRFSLVRWLMRKRATDPLILNFSQRMALVTHRILGISLQSFSKRFWSRKTSLLSLSLTLTLVHDFFLALPFLGPPLAAWAALEAPLPLSLSATCAFLAYLHKNLS